MTFFFKKCEPVIKFSVLLINAFDVLSMAMKLKIYSPLFQNLCCWRGHPQQHGLTTLVKNDQAVLQNLITLLNKINPETMVIKI